MAKGKRRKTGGLAKEVRRRAQAAEAASAPRRDVPAASALREDRLAATAQADALQFLLNYLNYVRDGGFHVPLDQFGPQRPGETAQEAELRRTVARRTKEVQAAAGDWAELCAEVLERAPLQIAPEAMVAHVAEVGQSWLKSAGHVPDRAEWIAGARPLLGVLCAPEHWLDAQNVLDQVGTLGIVPGEDAHLVADAAQATPAAALHAAAALVAWLYAQRSVVFDQTATMRRLAQQSYTLAESLRRA